MVLNAFAHAAGLEVGSFFDASAPQISANTREYQGESSALTFPKIPPALVHNAAGKAARFRRVPGSTASPTVLAPAARSSPRSLASIPPPYLDDTHAKLFGYWLCQILPLGIQHTLLLGTNFAPLLQAPRFPHTLGALGPKPHAAYQLFLRAAEAALGVSFNAQAQASDIPGISSRDALSVYFGSFNAQSKAPDIPSPSLRASIQELSTSFNAQDQAPDDPCHVQDSQYASRDWFSNQHHPHSAK